MKNVLIDLVSIVAFLIIFLVALLFGLLDGIKERICWRDENERN